jgi:hypothetical protein
MTVTGLRLCAKPEQRSHSIERSLFVRQSSDGKDTTGPEAVAGELDAIKDSGGLIII